MVEWLPGVLPSPTHPGVSVREGPLCGSGVMLPGLSHWDQPPSPVLTHRFPPMHLSKRHGLILEGVPLSLGLYFLFWSLTSKPCSFIPHTNWLGGYTLVPHTKMMPFYGVLCSSNVRSYSSKEFSGRARSRSPCLL